MNIESSTEPGPGLKMKTVGDFDLEEHTPKKKPNLLKERIRLKKLKEERKKQPKNIVKICDFGLSRSCAIPIKTLTHEVVTLWYRAPDILLGSKTYSSCCDIWSIGCIFAEMITNRPLFMGKSVEEQLNLIFCVRGSPEQNGWEQARDLPLSCPSKWASCYKQSLKDILNYSDPKGSLF